MAVQNNNTWVEIVVPISLGGDPEELSAQIVNGVPLAAAGTEIRQQEIVFWVKKQETETAVSQTIRALGVSTITTRTAACEAQWKEAYKTHFRTTRLTRQIVVVPSWETYQDFAARGNAQEKDIVVHLDPGLAFGTGLHSSTRLVLAELQQLRDTNAPLGGVPEIPCASQEALEPQEHPQLLDIGTGSGLLSIAAAKLWPKSESIGIDIDPIAVRTARENAQRNAVESQTHFSGNSLESIPHKFNIIVANIQANILCDMKRTITQRAAPSAQLLLAGILTDQIATVVQAYTVDMPWTVANTQGCPQDPQWALVRLTYVGCA